MGPVHRTVDGAQRGRGARGADGRRVVGLRAPKPLQQNDVHPSTTPSPKTFKHSNILCERHLPPRLQCRVSLGVSEACLLRRVRDRKLMLTCFDDRPRTRSARQGRLYLSGGGHSIPAGTFSYGSRVSLQPSHNCSLVIHAALRTSGGVCRVPNAVFGEFAASWLAKWTIQVAAGSITSLVLSLAFISPYASTFSASCSSCDSV